MEKAFEQIIKSAAEENKRESGDYVKNGLLYCGKCHTPKQTHVCFLGKESIVSCMCSCKKQTYEKEEAERKARELRDRIDRHRRDGFKGSDLINDTFEKDDGQDTRTMQIMQRYVQQFREKFMPEGKGLLLYGPCGTGKTFAAACVANALIDQGWQCLVTNFTTISNQLQGFHEGKQEYLDGYRTYRLVVIDDLGVERDTKYMQEIVYSFIDSMYRAKIPMLITTNLALKDLTQPENIEANRIYERILERCIPVEVSKVARRKRKISAEANEMKSLLGM